VKPRSVRIVLGGALVATVVASLWPGPAPEPADPRADAGPARPAARAASGVPALADRSAYADARVHRDPFAVAAAAPVRRVAVSAAPPPAPLPALPWQYGGRLQVPGRPDAVLLNDGARTHAVAAGETLDDWRLDADAGAQIAFTHLPSGQRIVLTLPP
jgi:hypothetical protein